MTVRDEVDEDGSAAVDALVRPSNHAVNSYSEHLTDAKKGSQSMERRLGDLADAGYARHRSPQKSR